MDGHNLEMGLGTGIATYASSTAELLSSMGHRLDVLYSKPVARGASDLVKEVQFFESPPQGKRGRAAEVVRGARMALRLCRTRPFRVPISSVTVAESRGEAVPVGAGVWNSPQLYWGAITRQLVTGGFTTLSNRGIQADVAHWTSPLPVRLKGAANVYCIHDMIPLRLPSTSGINKQAYFKLLNWIASTADLVLTVSEAARADIVELLEIDPAKVVNTYQCLPAAPGVEPAVANAALGGLGLKPRGYVLTCGAIEERKNFGRLTAAHRASSLKIPLVRTGPGKLPGDVVRRAAPGGVLDLGYVTRAELEGLIAGAACVAFPSLYEGFGLPIVEAFRCGAPVLTSDRNAMAEVAGEAACLVNPYDVASIAAGLDRVCGDRAYAEELVQRGDERLQAFAPDAIARRLAGAYARLERSGPANAPTAG